MSVRSKAQAKLMYAVKNNPKVAEKVGMKKEVAEEFINKTPKKRFSKLKEKLGKC